MRAAVVVGVVLAAFLGDQVGYLIGRKVGPRLFDRRDSRFFSRFFSRSHARSAHDFFLVHGPKAVILARFVPVVRTFTPTIAGVGAMPYRRFAAYNAIGATLWGVVSVLRATSPTAVTSTVKRVCSTSTGSQEPVM